VRGRALHQFTNQFFTFAGQAVSLFSKQLVTTWTVGGLFPDGTVLFSSHSHQSGRCLVAGEVGRGRPSCLLDQLLSVRDTSI
jgi:hypothetical protein